MNIYIQNRNNIKFYLIIFLVFFSFFWLAEIRPILSDGLNSVTRYGINIMVLFLYIIYSSKIYVNSLLYLLISINIILILLLNVIHLNFTIFSTSIFIFPILMILFYKNTKINKNINFNKIILVFHMILIYYAIKGYSLNLSGVLYQLNHNETAAYSFVLSFFSIILNELHKKIFSNSVYLNVSITLFIGYILDSRAIMISAIFMFILLLIKNIRKINTLIVFSLAIFSLIIPIVIIVFNEEIKLIHESLLSFFGATEDVFLADNSRYDMYMLIKETLNYNLFGKGFGNIDYLDVISISGLHSGTLDVLYWGGYIYYFIFMLTFILIIMYSYLKTKLFLSASLLLYWILLLNYYEGLLFGNMGLTILYIYLLISYLNEAMNEK